MLREHFKKVGPFEFRQTILAQKKEASEDIDSLKKQIEQVILTQKKEASEDIDSLKKQVVEQKPVGIGLGVESAQSVEPRPNVALPVLLEGFFQKYPRRFFSPYTVISWGGKQPGFKELDSFIKAEVTQALLSMLAAGKVQTKLSKKGNTLYGIRP